MIKRTVRRALVVLPAALGAAAAASVAAAAPASAASEVGMRTGSGMSLGEILLVFVGIPALIFVVCAVLVIAVAGNREPRLREGQAWWAQPEYFSGDKAEVESSATAGELTAGDDQQPGGSGARW